MEWSHIWVADNRSVSEEILIFYSTRIIIIVFIECPNFSYPQPDESSSDPKNVFLRSSFILRTLSLPQYCVLQGLSCSQIIRPKFCLGFLCVTCILHVSHIWNFYYDDQSTKNKTRERDKGTQQTPKRERKMGEKHKWKADNRKMGKGDEIETNGEKEDE